MQFYKKRDFGTLISDTFNFFKIYGKNYFKNYILINGLLLILMVILFVVGYREFFMQIFGSNTNGELYFFEEYFAENQAMLILVSVMVIILLIVTSVINYSYPVLYMKRVAETKTKEVKTDEILGDIKQNTGRILLLFLGITFIIGPLFLIVFGVSYLMILIIIGLFLLLLIIPTCINVVNFLFYDFLHVKRNFFESLSYSIRAQFSYPTGHEKSPFWKYWGSTIVLSIIIQIVNGIFTMIPMAIVFTRMITSIEQKTGDNPFDGTTGVIFFVTYGISILFSLILTNIIYINSGLMYYDNRTDLHREIKFDEIDTIGANEV